MKKLYCLILFFLLHLFVPSLADAKSYSISPVKIEAELQKNGSMAVEESRTFHFDGDFTFAYQKINSIPNQSTSPGRTEKYRLSNFSICDSTQCYRQLTLSEINAADDSRPTNTFYVLENSDSYYIKWFYRSSSSKTFTLRYTVENAITLHSDVAELYWQLIGDEWEVGQQSVTASIQLPTSFDFNQVKAWAHGPSSGTVSIDEEGRVTYQLAEAPIGQFFEARIIMPKSVFTRGAVGTNSQALIEGQEQRWIEESIKEAGRKAFQDKFVAGGLMIAFLLLLFRNFKSWRSFWIYHRDLPLPKINQSGTLWEPPSDIDAAQIEQLISGKEQLSPKAFTATLLSLVQARIYKLVRSEQKKGILFKDYEYYLEKTSDDESAKIHQLSSIQQLALSVVERVGTKNVAFAGQKRAVVPLKKIVSYFRNHPTFGREFFLQTMPKTVLKENLAENYFAKESADPKRKQGLGITIALDIVFAVGLIFVLAVAAENDWNYSLLLAMLMMTVAVVAIFVQGMMVGNYLQRTNKGRQEAASWLAFKKHIKDYKTTAKYPIDSIVLWEKYLVYGTALGISAKTLAALPISIPADQSGTASAYWAGINSSSSGGALTSFDLSGLTSALSGMGQISTQSYGASGVGSSGGASGGGGGGGGGGSGGAG